MSAQLRDEVLDPVKRRPTQIPPPREQQEIIVHPVVKGGQEEQELVHQGERQNGPEVGSRWSNSLITR